MDKYGTYRYFSVYHVKNQQGINHQTSEVRHCDVTTKWTFYPYSYVISLETSKEEDAHWFYVKQST